MTEQTHWPWYGDAGEDPIHVAAAEWFTRLEDGHVSVEDMLVWQRWMAADARHAEAFRRIEEVWMEFAPLQNLPKSPAAHPRPVLRLALAASATLAAIGISALLLMNDALVWRQLAAAAVETDIGEVETLRLTDGSEVTLGGGTRLKLAFGDTSRDLELVRGEALFSVVKDELRPFTVHAGEATVTAVGTQFNVRRAGDRTTVAVVEGRVMVAKSPLPAPVAWLRERVPRPEPVRLDAGQQTRVDQQGVEAASLLADPAMVTAWRTGRLAFEQEPLRYVIENVNRYAAKPIVIADPRIGELKITGTVLNSNVSGWIESLESAFALEAVEQPERILLARAHGSDAESK